MTKPRSLQALQSTLAEALSSFGRDQLVEVLTSVLQAYVIESPPRFDGPSGVQTLPDLANVPFAQLVTALQMSCEQPELAALRVDGVNVQVRVSGQWVPLVAPTAATSTLASVPTPVPVPRPSLGPVPVPEPAPISGPAPATGKSDQKPDSNESPGVDRFSLLELD